MKIPQVTKYNFYKNKTGNFIPFYKKDKHFIHTQKDCFAFKSSNISTPKPELDDDTFIIRMKYYNQDYTWAKKMNNFTYEISDMMSENFDFDEILETIEKKLPYISTNEFSFLFGQRKSSRGLFTLEKCDRGDEYYKKYLRMLKFGLNKASKGVLQPKSNKEYENAHISIIKYYSDTIYVYCGNDAKNPQYNLTLAKKEYEKLKSTKNPSLDEINASCATIHWLITQETPYIRGSQSVANIITKALYNSYGIKVLRIKKGKSWDFEALYRNLDDYIKVYPKLFEIPPKK